MSLGAWKLAATVTVVLCMAVVMVPPANEKKPGAPIRWWPPIVLGVLVIILVTCIIGMISTIPPGAW